MKDDRRPGRDTPFIDIDPDVMPSVGYHRVFVAGAIGGNGQPIGKRSKVQDVGVTLPAGRRDDAQRSRIIARMPDDPGFRGLDLRILGESEPPTDADLRPPDWRWRIPA